MPILRENTEARILATSPHKRITKRFPARFYDTATWDTVTCRLCPHLCSIAPSRSGTCGVRSNRNGMLYCDNYGKVASTEVVPAMRLPMYHYMPDTSWLLVAIKGCNFRCTFCNTFNFSQVGGVRTVAVPPEDLAQLAVELGCRGIVFGVNEPLVSHEYVFDVFQFARDRGLRTALMTNGEWLEDPFAEMIQVADAIVFGFKEFDTHLYMQECGGQLDVVKRNVEVALARGVHVETTYLVIEQHKEWRLNLNNFGRWLGDLNPRVPTMLLRLTKDFTWQGESTTMSAAREARELLSQHLQFVYLHDMNDGKMDTSCRSCGKVLVRRGSFGTLMSQPNMEKCPQCGADLPFVAG